MRLFTVSAVFPLKPQNVCVGRRGCFISTGVYSFRYRTNLLPTLSTTLPTSSKALPTLSIILPTLSATA